MKASPYRYFRQENLTKQLMDASSFNQSFLANHFRGLSPTQKKWFAINQPWEPDCLFTRV